MHLFHPHASDAPDLGHLYAHPPGVRLGMVSSLDGSAALDGASKGLSGPADKQVFGVLRRQSDVILVGAGTARSEGYRPVRTSEQDRAERVARGQQPVPRLAVLSRGQGLDPTSPLLAPDSGLLLLTSAEGAAQAPDHVDAVVVDGPAAAIAALRERGLVRILCEGGPSLNGALLSAGLVDEICQTVSPLLAGGDGPRTVVGSPERAAGLELAHLLHADGMLLGRWTVRRSGDA